MIIHITCFNSQNNAPMDLTVTIEDGKGTMQVGDRMTEIESIRYEIRGES